MTAVVAEVPTDRLDQEPNQGLWGAEKALAVIYKIAHADAAGRTALLRAHNLSLFKEI